jgi:hypothetical protein
MGGESSVAYFSPFRTLYSSGRYKPVPSWSSRLPAGDNPYARNQYATDQVTNWQSTYPTLPQQPPMAPLGATPAGGTPPAGAGFAPPPASFGGADLSSDPILAQVQAFNQRVLQQAEASALAAKKSALIQFGSPELAEKTIHDTNTATAAKENPFSTLAQLLFAFNRNRQGIDQTRNAQNLFYSSTRANDVTGEGKNYLQNQSLAQGQVEGALRGYDEQVLSAQQAAMDRWLSALADAYERWLRTHQGGGGGGGGADPGASGVPPGSAGYAGYWAPGAGYTAAPNYIPYTGRSRRPRAV